MNLEQDEFTGTLKGKIIEVERKMGKLCDRLNLKYQEAAAANNLDVKFQMSRKGFDTFSPYYCSDVTLGIARNEMVLETHRFVIWECQRLLFGMPMKWNIPGSKIVGNFMDESYENVALKLEEHMEEFLNRN